MRSCMVIVNENIEYLGRQDMIVGAITRMKLNGVYLSVRGYRYLGEGRVACGMVADVCHHANLREGFIFNSTLQLILNNNKLDN